MEKFIQNLEEAERLSAKVNHLLYVTFPMLQDKRILFKILEEINQTNIKCINSILHYEYLKGKIQLYKDPKLNLKTFIEKSSKKYKITDQEILTILEVFSIFKKHKSSPVEFIKGKNLIILSNDMRPTVISSEKVKSFCSVSTSFLEKTKRGIRKKYKNSEVF